MSPATLSGTWDGPCAAPSSALPPAQDQGLVPSCAAWAVWLAATYRRARLNGVAWSSPPAANPSYLMNLSVWEATANQLGPSKRQVVKRPDVVSYLRDLAGTPGTTGALGAALGDARHVVKYLARSGSPTWSPLGLTPFVDAQPPAGQSLSNSWPYSSSPPPPIYKLNLTLAGLDSVLLGTPSAPPMPVVAKIRPCTKFVGLTPADSQPYSPGTPVGPSHYVVIVGVDSTKSHYLVRNSWGAGWGATGDFVLKRAKLSPSSSPSAFTRELWTLASATQTITPPVPPNFNGSASGWWPAAAGPGWNLSNATLRSATAPHSFASGVVPWLSDAVDAVAAAQSTFGARLRATAGGHHDPTPRSLALRAPAVPFVPALADYRVRWSVEGVAAGASGAPVDLGAVPGPWKGVFEYWDRAPGTVPGPETGPDPDETGIYVERAKFRLVNPSAASVAPPSPLSVKAEVFLPGQPPGGAGLTRTWNVTVL